jgi:hypothetical protein
VNTIPVSTWPNQSGNPAKLQTGSQFSNTESNQK